MFRSLHFKFIAGWLLFLAAGFLAVQVYSGTELRRYLRDTEGSALYREASALSVSIADSYTDGRPAEMSQSMKSISRMLEARVWLMDTAGRIIYDDTGSFTGRTVERFDPLDWSSSYRYDNFYGIFSEPQLSVCMPVVSRYRLVGYVMILKAESRLAPRYNASVNRIFAVYVILSALSLFLLLLFRFLVTRPMKKLLKGAQEHADGNLTYQIGLKSHDETGRLARLMELTASRVSDMDEYQRKFVANVSHDFRSPLTSISGYLDAMLDGTIPPEGRDRYLRIVRSETDRLMHLTQNLLALNAAGDKGALLSRTVFDINRVIKAICETFEGSCGEKDLVFDLTFDEKERPVWADLGKIQQVLYNLIDNALKFSREGGTIWIETYREGEKVFVSVKDDGIGIPRDALPKIWERFYKTDASRGKDKKGSGLGLSIVKEIIDAHGEQIDCISTEGAGSRFTFTLPPPREE